MMAAKPQWRDVNPNFSGSAMAMRNALAGFGQAQQAAQNFSSMIDRRAAAEEEQRRWDIANQRIEDKLALEAADRAKLEAEEALLSKLLKPGTDGTIGTKKVTKDRIVKAATAGNEKEIEALRRYNAEVMSGQEAFEKETQDRVAKYNQLLAEYSKPMTEDRLIKEAEARGELVRKKEQIPGSSAVNTYYTKPSGARLNPLEQGWATLKDKLGFGDTKFVNAIDNPEELAYKHGVIAAPVVDDKGNILEPSKVQTGIPDANERALKESGLLELSMKGAKMGTVKDIPALKKATKAVVEKITTEVPYTKQEKDTISRDMMLRNIMSSGLRGSTKIDALEKVNKLFPQAKPLTPAEQLAMARHKKDIIDEAKEMEYYRNMYKGKMPSNIDSLAGMKNWASIYEKRQDKDSDKKQESTIGPKTLAAYYDAGIGDIDDDDQVKFENTVKQYKIKDSEVANILKTYAKDKDLLPRFSENIVDDAINYIKDNYSKK